MTEEYPLKIVIYYKIYNCKEIDVSGKQYKKIISDSGFPTR